MCGWVFALLQQNSTAGVVDLPSLIEAIRLRGPDSYQYNQQPITDDGTLQLTIAASVLHLRGLNPTTQPFPILPPNCNSALDANGCDRINNNCPDWICWNGQIFSINGRPIDGEDGQIVDDTLSDTRLLAHLLSTYDHESQDCDNGDFARHLCNVLSSIDDGPWAFAYHDTARKRLYFARDRLGRRSLLWTVPNSIDDSSNSSTYPDVTSLINSFGNSFIVCSVSCGPLPADGPLRWAEVPCDGLFCLDYSAKSLRCIPWTVVDSRTFVDGGSNIDGQLITTYPVSLNAAYTTTADYTAEMTRFHRILSESVRRRIINIPGPVVSGTGRLAVLFSGGLDCTILAALCHKYLPPNEPIDLLNVAFENPGSAHYHKKTIDDAAIFMVPDRITGRRSAQELRRLIPQRNWRLVEVDVKLDEYLQYKSQILSTIHPSDTVMDLSIAAALYFAAKAEPNARVLLSGLGADELFAGYSRHRSAFQRNWPDEEQAYRDLADELQMDLRRLPSRNLGRDDRIISSLGKEVRFPFLSEPVVRFAAGLPLNWKCDLRPSTPRAVGEKLWLRRYAVDFLSLTGAAAEQKRAIQFGARSAKIENRRERGGDLIIG